MINRHRLIPAIAIAAICAASASGAIAATISKAEYSAESDRIKMEYKTAREGCSSSSGNDKNVCLQQAKSNEEVALTTLTYRYSGKASDAVKVSIAKADGAYAVEKTICAGKTGAQRDVCNAEAKSTHTKARADAKLEKSINDSKADSQESKLAAAECQKLSGEQQKACVTNMKTKADKPLQTDAMSGQASEATPPSAAAKLESDYKLEIGKCKKLSGEQQESCITAADLKFNKIARTKAQTNAKLRDATIEQKAVSPADKMEADYQAAMAKCKKQSGEQMDACIGAAKLHFNKN